MSTGLVAVESCDDLYECEVVEETEDIAESMDDVRGTERSSACPALPAVVEEAIEKGEYGGEPAVDLE